MDQETLQELKAQALDQAVVHMGNQMNANPSYMPIPSEVVNWANAFYNFLANEGESHA